LRVPNWQHAQIPALKITGYLLSETHRDGKHKAAFFKSFGFSAASWERLAESLQQHVAENNVVRVEPSPFGMRYIIEGALRTPKGISPIVRSVWFIESGTKVPRLVTAYPVKSVRTY